MSYFTRNMDKCSRLHSFPVTRYIRRGRRGEQKKPNPAPYSPWDIEKKLLVCVDIFYLLNFFCIFMQIKIRNSQKTIYHYSCCNISVPFHYCPPALYMERGGGERCPFPPFPPCFHPDVLYSWEGRRVSPSSLPSLFPPRHRHMCCAVQLLFLLPSPCCKKKKDEMWKTRNRKEKRLREKMRNTWNCICCAWRCNPRCGTRGRCIEKERERSTDSTDWKREIYL